MPGIDEMMPYRPSYQLRRCSVTLNKDMSVDVDVEEEISADSGVDFIEFFIPFKESRFNTKIKEIFFDNVIESIFFYNQKKSRITSVIYKCSLEKISQGIFPKFRYHEIGRVQEFQGILPEWDWENNLSEKGLVYEEIWGGSRILYNLSFDLPIDYLPIWIFSSKKLLYSINIYKDIINIYFPDFIGTGNISIVYRYAPLSYKFIKDNPEILIENQSNLKNLLYTINQNIRFVNNPLSVNSKKILSGRPRNQDDDWAWDQIYIYGQNITIVRKEWDRRNRERERDLADPDRSFRHAIKPERKKKE